MTSTAAPAQPTGRARQSIAVVCAILAGLLIAPTVFGAWFTRVLVNEERYMAIVSPLSSDPAVQNSVSSTATGVIDTAIEGLPIDSLIPSLPGPLDELVNGLRQKATDAATGKVDEVTTSFVASDQFAGAWDTINRNVHASLVLAFRGEESGALTISDGTMSVNAAVVIEALRDALVARGLTVLQNVQVPAMVDKQIPIVQSENLGRLQSLVRIGDETSGWLPWVVLALAVVAVGLAVRRGVAMLWLGALGTAGMLVGLLLIAAVGPGIGNAITPGPLEPAVQAVVSALIGSLRTWILIAGAITLAIGIVGWFVHRTEVRTPDPGAS